LGIHEKRFLKAINQIIKEELQKGNLPSSKEVMWRLNQYLRDHNLSRPNYDFKPVRRGMLARSYDYNDTMHRVHEDLETLYENTIDLHNGLDKNFNKFEVDKSKLEYQINSLENKLKELILLYGKSGFLNSVYDVFDDLEKINVANTTAHVDIKRHEVSIPDIKSTSTRIMPDAYASFHLLEEIAPSVEGKTVSGIPSDALNDSINATWQYLVKSKTKQTVAGYYYMNFDQKQIMNRIAIHLQSIKPTDVRVDFTPDGMNWFGLPYYENGVEISDEFVFDFPSIEVQEIRILMTKDEPDNETSSTAGLDYNYVFGIKKIQMFQLDFSENATMVSQPLVVEVPATQNFSINKVSLLVDEFLENGTDIQYYIAMPPAEGDEPEWKAISPVNRDNPKHNQIIDFKNITRAPAQRFSIDPTLSIGEYELESLYTNGINFYSIGEIEGKKVINNSERLFVGRNSWGIKSFPGQYTDHDKHIPKLEDWDKPLHNIRYDYAAMEDGKPGLILDRKRHTAPESYMITTGVFSEKASETVSIIPASTEPITIYMNGTQVYQGIPSASTQVDLTFKNGWNEIVVLAYVRNFEAANGVTIDMNIDPRKYGSNVYSKAQPMEKVSLFDLRYNVKSNDRNKYAIMEANEKQYIVLNHAAPGLEYDFYFHYVDGAAKETILLKADFTRDRTVTNISPKLKSYRLRFS
jgi:hypothetical protein